MKTFILSLLLSVITLTAFAGEVQNDTIAVNNSEIVKLVEDDTTNSKGQKVTKYYFLYNGELIQTSRHVVESYNLCKKHNVKCHLAMVVNRKNNRKRIILN